MHLNQEDANRLLIYASWITLAGSIVGMVVCLGLWAAGIISHEAIDVSTNVLSWLAIVGTAGQVLVSAYVKRDVDES